MKKSKVILLGVILVFCIGIFTACGKDDGSNGSTTGTDGNMGSKAEEMVTDAGSKAHEIATDAGSKAKEIVTDVETKAKEIGSDIGNGIDNVEDRLEGNTEMHR